MQCFGEHRVPELIEDVRHLQASVHAKHPHYMWGTTNMFIGVHSLKTGFIRMLRRYSHIGSQGSLIEGAEVREGAEAYAFITVLPGKEGTKPHTAQISSQMLLLRAPTMFSIKLNQTASCHWQLHCSCRGI